MLHLHDGWTELNSCVDLMLQESSKTLPGHEDVCRHLLEVVLIQLARQQDLSFPARLPAPGPARSAS